MVVVELPEWLEAALSFHSAPGGMVQHRADARHSYAYTRAAMDRLFWLVATTPEGQRNTNLNAAAHRLGQLGVPYEKARGMLTRAALRAGLAEPEISRTIASGYSAFGCHTVAA